MAPKQTSEKKNNVSFEGVEIPDDLVHNQAVYTHPDPLLRRIRLENPKGQPIHDIKSYFAGKKIIVFYFGSSDEDNTFKSSHKNLTELTIKHGQDLALIYVSGDTKESDMRQSLQQKPWLRMTFHDGSDFAPMSKTPAPAAVSELLRGEDFVSAAEYEDGYVLPREGIDDPIEYSYVRPLSRAALIAHFNALRSPTISIYHLPSHKMINRYARPEEFQKPRLGRSLELWKQGRTTGYTTSDIYSAFKVPMVMGILALIYHFFIHFFGSEYSIPNLIAYFFNEPISSSLTPTGSGPHLTSVLAASSIPAGDVVREAVKSLPTMSTTLAAL
ncbi:Thioredoxin-like fold [Phaffia rhodozyma]|uniref:Thioredoxin-like fold n=1 Tax=Phaffia rhodozyma TaxID=264483 RepID=A0A0F7SKD1_PHARH|nr:Thioredoxin-like fold [Phaffia rhodozyma]